MEDHSTSSSHQSMEEEYSLSEQTLHVLLDEIFASNQDKDLIEGLDILLKFIAK